MPNTLYTTTKQINDLIPQLNEKYGMPNYHNFTGAIQAPHIRQILFELKEVLTGPNIIIKECGDGFYAVTTDNKWIFSLNKRFGFEGYQRDLICPRGANKIDRCHIANDFLNNSKRVFPSKKTLEDEIKKYLLDTEYTFSAKALCQKWLDGLTPLIDTEHEKVLTELLEVLKKLV